MEDKDLNEEIKPISSTYSGHSKNQADLSDNFLTELDFLTRSLDDITNDFDKEIEDIEKKASLSSVPNTAEFIQKQQSSHTSSIKEEINDILEINNPKEPESFEKAQNLINNISSSQVFKDDLSNVGKHQRREVSIENNILTDVPQEKVQAEEIIIRVTDNISLEFEINNRLLEVDFSFSIKEQKGE